MKTNEQHATDDSEENATENVIEIKNNANTESTEKSSINPDGIKPAYEEEIKREQNDREHQHEFTVPVEDANSNKNPEEINGLGADEQMTETDSDAIQPTIEHADSENK